MNRVRNSEQVCSSHAELLTSFRFFGSLLWFNGLKPHFGLWSPLPTTINFACRNRTVHILKVFWKNYSIANREGIQQVNKFRSSRKDFISGLHTFSFFPSPLKSIFPNFANKCINLPQQLLRTGVMPLTTTTTRCKLLKQQS